MFKPQPVLKKYYEGLDEGKIYGTKCNDCGRVNWPPYPICQNGECTSNDLEWTELSGDVTVEHLRKVQPMFLPGAWRHYRPFLQGRCVTSEGTQFNTLVQGVSNKEYDELFPKLPLRGKLNITNFSDTIKTVTVVLAED